MVEDDDACWFWPITLHYEGDFIGVDPNGPVGHWDAVAQSEISCGACARVVSRNDDILRAVFFVESIRGEE